MIGLCWCSCYYGIVIINNTIRNDVGDYKEEDRPASCKSHLNSMTPFLPSAQTGSAFTLFFPESPRQYGLTCSVPPGPQVAEDI